MINMVNINKDAEETCFNFRITTTPEGNQIINRSLKTPINSLTPLQMLEYIEVESQLDFFALQERKQRREAQKRNGFLYKIIKNVACM